MPFIFTIIGILFVVIGARGQSSNAIALLKSEFTGPKSFIQFFIAIMVIGLLGYIKPIKPVSDAFLVLIILVLFLSNKGVFANFETALQNTQPTPSPNSTSSTGGNQTASNTTSATQIGIYNPYVSASTTQPSGYNGSTGINDGGLSSVEQSLLTPYAPSYDSQGVVGYGGGGSVPEIPVFTGG